MSDPAAAVAVAGRAVSAIRGTRARRLGNASNVVFITEFRPRQLAGYRALCMIHNQSSVGVADIAVRLDLAAGGNLELDGRIMQTAVEFASAALAGGATLTVEFPHRVRIAETSFDLEVDRGPGYDATLFWRDEAGKRWRRTGAGRAVTCRARDYPSPNC